MAMIPAFRALNPKLADWLVREENHPSVALVVDLYMGAWDFDERWYTAAYPDVQQAIEKGLFTNGWRHFRAIGYREGRLPVEPSVDAEWYMLTYPDVTSAIVGGSFSDALEHYSAFGCREGRLPCDPGVQPAWYAPRYLPADRQARADRALCTEHFVREGYVNGALPVAPR